MDRVSVLQSGQTSVLSNWKRLNFYGYIMATFVLQGWAGNSVSTVCQRPARHEAQRDDAVQRVHEHRAFHADGDALH